MRHYFVALTLAVSFLVATNANAAMILSSDLVNGNGGQWVDQGWNETVGGYQQSGLTELFRVTIAGHSNHLYITNVNSDVLGVNAPFVHPGSAGGNVNGTIRKDNVGQNAANSTSRAHSTFTSNGLTVTLQEGARRNPSGRQFNSPYTLSITTPDTWVYDSFDIVFNAQNNYWNNNGLPSDFNSGNGWGNTDLDFDNFNTTFTTWHQFGTFVTDYNRWMHFDLAIMGFYQEWVETERWVENWVWVPTNDGGGHPIPEPGTLAMLGLGLAGLGVARRRMKK